MYRKYRVLLILTAAALFLPAYGATTATFMVIGSPGVCTLYDQYEQLLSPAKKKNLPKHAPFEIISSSELMGDQITQARRLHLHGTTYYLLLDENGAVTGVPPAASSLRYTHSTPQYDTLVVTASSLALMSKPSGGTRRLTLDKGDIVLRVFSWRGAHYLLSLGSRQVYGWTGNTGNRLRPKESGRASSGASTDHFAPLHVRIMKQLNEANERYDSLFTYFNTRTGQQKAVPHWVAPTGTVHRYTLEGSDEVIRVLENSTSQIVRDIERLLLGKPFEASYRHGTITIGPR